MVINITCFKIPGSGFIFAASEYPSMADKEVIQYTNVLFTQSLDVLRKRDGTEIIFEGVVSDCDVCTVGKAQQLVYPKTANPEVNRSFQLYYWDSVMRKS